MVEKVTVQNSLWTCDIELSTNNLKDFFLDVVSLGLMWLCIGLFINSIQNKLDIIIHLIYNLLIKVILSHQFNYLICFE
jgi:hypothetical protein